MIKILILVIFLSSNAQAFQLNHAKYSKNLAEKNLNFMRKNYKNEDWKTIVNAINKAVEKGEFKTTVFFNDEFESEFSASLIKKGYKIFEIGAMQYEISW